MYRQYEDLSALAFDLDAPVGVVSPRSAGLWCRISSRRSTTVIPRRRHTSKKADEAPVVLIVQETALRSFRHNELAETLRPNGAVGQ